MKPSSFYQQQLKKHGLEPPALVKFTDKDRENIRKIHNQNWKQRNFNNFNNIYL